MENIPILKDLVILMAVSVPVTILSQRLGLPTIIGFLVTGIIISPYSTGLVTNLGAVENLAQLGVVLILFTVGIELSFAKIVQVGKGAMVGGVLQIVLTTGLSAIAASLFDLPLPETLVIGFVVAQSSTAIILKILADKGEIDSPAGKLTLGISIVQDLATVPMVLTIQGMTGPDTISVLNLAKSLMMAGLIIGIILVSANFLVPRLLYQVVRLRSSEVFTFSTILICIGTAWLTYSAGLSLAIGAFIAGLVISESEYGHRITSEILPLKSLFVSLFFISIGMLLDPRYFLSHMNILLPLAGIIILAKILILVGIGQMLKYPFRLAVIVGIGLSNIGEFSFLLLQTGEDLGVVSNETYQAFLAIAILTMAITPFLINRSSDIAFRIARLLRIRISATSQIPDSGLSDHVIIVGYGLNGMNLAKVLKETGIRFMILDLNWERIRLAKKEGYKAMYGDTSNAEILKKAGIEKARMMVIAISDPVATRHIVKMGIEENEKLYILVRTRYINEVEELYKLGASQVIPEEFETSVEIFSRVLKEYHVPGNIIQNQIDFIRYEGYAMFRTPSLPQEKLMEISSLLATSVTETFFVYKDSHLIGKTLAEIDLRKKSGVMVLAVIRKAATNTNPPADLAVEEGDILALIGSHAQIDKAMQVLKDRQFS